MSDVERTSAGLQIVIPGCERRTLPKSTTRVDEIIRTQKFQGASADLLNANIIARDLGLADKTELTGKDGGPVRLTNMSDADLERIAAGSS